MNIRIFTIVLLISVQVIVCAENEDENDQDPFVPTDEWKPIKKGKLQKLLPNKLISNYNLFCNYE